MSQIKTFTSSNVIYFVTGTVTRTSQEGCIMKDTSKSWFCVFNNPEEHGYEGMEPEEILKTMEDAWLATYPQGSCWLAYCVSKEGLPHVHAVFENGKTARFTVIKKAFPEMHIEPTKGSKRQVEDYIHKRGKFEEKGERVVCQKTHGDICGCAQGRRSDLDEIERLIDEGMTPDDIFHVSFRYRKYETMIRRHFYEKRVHEAPAERDIRVFYHVGDSGSGKSHVQVDVKERAGQGDVYVMTDYEGGGLDAYCGQKVLFMDEFRCQIRYATLLQMLDRYPNQLHARYANIWALWEEVHVTSILPPERLYENMVEQNRDVDTFEQLRRRITSVVYHEKVEGQYLIYEKSMRDYVNYETLRMEARTAWNGFLAA